MFELDPFENFIFFAELVFSSTAQFFKRYSMVLDKLLVSLTVVIIFNLY